MNVKFLLSLFIASSSFVSSSASFLEHSYCRFLGSTDASAQYQTIIRQALYLLDVPNAQTVAIKKMGNFTPSIFGSSLYSFTACGIWINEQLLNECSPAERTFALYHEAAHYALNHHRHVALRCLPLPFLMAALITLGTKCSSSLVKQIAASLALGSATAYTFDAFVLHPLVMDQEQEADLAAAKILRDHGKGSVVDEYVAELSNLVHHGLGSHSDGWHATYAQQVKYLSNCVS